MTPDTDAPAISVTEPPPIPDALRAALAAEDMNYAAFEWRVPSPSQVDWDAVPGMHATGWFHGERI